MKKLNEILKWATSDLAVALYAVIIAGVLLAKGVAIIGGAGLGIACVKLWSATKSLIK
jgi:hypothetical protein|tara:strand:- start:977 stop:1150 length:174 start_codon:yes stop_codon:yes gene_type:complete